MNFNKTHGLLIGLVVLFNACITDAPLNSEADILAFSFPDNAIISEAEISNNYIVNHPLIIITSTDTVTAQLESMPFDIKVTPGASWERIDRTQVNDTLFAIKVTSENKRYNKIYSILQMRNFTSSYSFENWTVPSLRFQFENPKEGDTQWYSSNNGVAIAWSSASKAADEYPVRKTTESTDGNYGAEIRTMVGPGSVGGGVNFIPCISGSLYLGGFNVISGISKPLQSTLFGIPFNAGKPSRLTGYYKYREGTDEYINGDGTTDPAKKDYCDIYAVLFKVDSNVKYLYGDNIDTSDRIIAKARLPRESIVQGDEFIRFNLPFDYDSYAVPFIEEELRNNEYKITMVFTSSSRGAFYEGRPGSRLVIDDIKLIYD